MTTTALPSPIITFIDDPLAFVANTNPEAGPSAFHMGAGIMDPRPVYTFEPGSDVGASCMGWFGQTPLAINQVPSTIADNNIAASQTPGAGIRVVTLVAASGAGITVGVTTQNGTTGLTVTGLLAIDSAMATVRFGQSGTVQAWDPRFSISRAARITSGGNDTGVIFTINGYDVFGIPMTENITGANAGIALGKKAYKYIASITMNADVATTVKVGTSDIYGFPIRSDFFGLQQIFWNNALITANTGYLVPDATSPATLVTGDVRGTYATQSASDGTKRLTVYVTIPPANLPTAVGLYGVTQR